MASPTINMAEVRSYWEDREQKKRQAEAELAEVTKVIMASYEKLSQDYDTEVLDRERDVDFTRRIQRENRILKSQLEDIEKKRERDSTCLVLIDGDGLLFEDKYVQGGRRGGDEAAADLLKHISELVRNSDDIPSDTKIIVRIFANLQGLAKTYEQADIADSNTVVEFARGFTMARALFDFVDCGSGKERADNKIRATFSLNNNSLQCRHIILGCSHDNGYARLLEELQTHETERVTLLEGVPFTKELSILTNRFGSTKFKGIFRDTKIETYSNFQKRPQVNGEQHLSSASNVFATSRDGVTAKSSYMYNSPYDILRPGSTSTTESGPATVPSNASLSTSPPVSNWAGRAQAAAALPSPVASARPSVSQSVEPTIKRNRRGQRLDPPKPKELDMQLLQKVQNMKLCNNFFLKDYCHNANSSCEHDHYYKPSAKELAMLKYIARRIPCMRGTTCDDPRCTAGHRCAFFENGDCRFKNQGTCKFSNDMHYSDLIEIKSVVVK